uniref:BolA-like protein n=1 Tax=Eucampia antarctica TaxID=49252 RepID=A0A7S2S243_9STRA|mmetsp:Transcript_29915/g.28793  ORF Transcript_29915/g.28793 Transcript_29915/m.28793 type:complete len:139 (+) Transcript_29915:26-442(+)|eukprot:CAMPEP_0197832142 /NCGR_PEP_ID=MMETSP1437-20131217/13466_1 /TAXON_ID=49252 ORGANISM="Eucampia antarctica, Strain CCMP1452" /NCGR_SAMPLE_ID=MMETSP1437 /ASSEMBLY_ACC=CAM_ASM_001096 /LENGTH=138 /DNA_ID=CAMNT_0043435347 /DNA_START=26 /DNA_END=445 /DNA_ORIENTATION=+
MAMAFTRLAIILVIMISASVRAFTTRNPALSGMKSRLTSTSQILIARPMSTQDSPEGGPAIVDVCKGKISKLLETDDVRVTGAYDDPNGSHISVEVVSPLFAGKRAVQRQQMVYKAIWEELQGPVHAVDSMICKTPDE